MELHLAGRRALITGGSRGIGLACAHALAAEGVDLALAARTVEPLKAATRELRDTYDVAVTSHSCDLARPDHQRALADVVGALDIVVNCAGSMPPGDLESLDDEAWREAWDLNVFGVIGLCRLLLPTMLAAGAGVIVNVIGRPADDDPADHLAGAAGGAALEALTRTLGADCAEEGVRVVGVRIPSDRPQLAAMPVADVVVFLASDRASMVSGIVLAVDGGAGAR